MGTQLHLDAVARRALLTSGRLRGVFGAIELDVGEREAASLVRASTVKDSLLGDTAPRSWVHLCCYGEYKAHPAGPFTFDVACFETFVRNFDRQANQIPWTVGHPFETTPSEGWLLGLEIRGNTTGAGTGLWGLVEWTAPTAQKIADGGWKFCSVVFDLEGRDRKTGDAIGPELIEVGLTNTPFIDGQTPIVLLERIPAMSKKKTRDYTALAKKSGTTADALQTVMDDVASALDMDAADVDEIVARVKAIADAIKALSPKAVPPTGDVADAAKMSAEDRGKWIARLAAWAKLLAKLDGATMPDAAMIGGGGQPATPDSETGEATLLGAIQKIGAAAGLDDAKLAAWLDANADAVVGLIGGQAPAAMSRELGDLKVKLQAANAGRDELAVKVAELSKDLTDRRVAEAKLAADAQDAEREKAIEDARKAGKLALGALDPATKKHAQGPQEVALRAAFTRDHKLGMELVASLPQVVPLETITEDAGAKPAGAGGGGTEAMGSDPKDLKTFDFKPRSKAEEAILKMNARNRSVQAHALQLHRDASAQR